MNPPTLLEGIASVGWVAFAFVLLVAVLPEARRVLKSRQFRVKYRDLEVSVQDVSDQLRHQIQDLQNQLIELSRRVDDSPGRAADVPSPPAPSNRTILWVDDNPGGNLFEIARFEADGFEVTLAESTAEALQILHRRALQPGAVVAALSGEDDGARESEACVGLLRNLRREGVDTPVFVYSSPPGAERCRQRMTEAGAQEVTASPFRLLVSVEEELSLRA